MRGSRTARGIFVGLWLLVGACTGEDLKVAQPEAVVSRSAAATTSADAGWRQIDTALEFRTLELRIDQRRAEFAVIRLDPKAYHIRVAYDSANPGRVSEWAAAVKPIALINGGYFDAEKKATALVIFDGITRGASYEGFGGMVVVNANGEFELRSLRQQPYDTAEPLQQAMQSAPMLIQPGGVLSELDADDNRSRRTVIARDTSGRILLMACDFPVLTLQELGTLLKASDLELDAALNLDGGRSTGMYLRTEQTQFTIDSFDSVPLVLVVDRKQ